jgi:selenocysteine lyase/cysteine desulfurase
MMLSDSARPRGFAGSQREAFDVPAEIAYFNTANLAPQLNCVRQAGEAALRSRARPWEISPEDWFADVDRLRAGFSRIIGSDPNDIALVPATSYGFATAARNIPLSDEDRVLVLSDEYPSGVYTWQAAARASSVERRAPRCSPCHARTARPGLRQFSRPWTSVSPSSACRTCTGPTGRPSSCRNRRPGAHRWGAAGH